MFTFFKRLREAIEAWKYRKLKSEYLEGYEYAAGKLIQGNPNLNIQYLESYLEQQRDFNMYNDFDKGVEYAIKDFKKLINK